MIVRTTKNKDNPYYIKNRTAPNDPGLTWKAKGLHDYLMSKPDHWEALVPDLVAASADGETVVRSALNELIAHGYMHRVRLVTEKGRVSKWRLDAYESPSVNPYWENPDVENPDVENPDVENPDVENPDVENQALVINDLRVSNDIAGNNEGRDPIIQDHPAPQPVTPPPPTTVVTVPPISQPEPATPITPLSTVPVTHSEDSPAGAAGHRTAGQRTGDLCMDAALARFEGTWGRRNEQQVVDGLTRQVEAMGLTREGFRLLVDEFLRKYGKLEMASLQTETATKALAKAQDIVLSICGIDPRFRSMDGLNTIFASWRANDYRGASLPTGEQLLEHAGKMKAGAVTCERKDESYASKNRNSGGSAKQLADPVGGTAPDYSRYNRNRRNLSA